MSMDEMTLYKAVPLPTWERCRDKIGQVVLNEIPKPYRSVLAPGYALVSAPDGDCFFHSLLTFYRHIPNTRVDGEEFV